MRRIKCIQYPLAQSPDDTVVPGGVETITCGADGVRFVQANGDETCTGQYDDRRHPQVFVHEQNYWFIEFSDDWAERWNLNHRSPGRQVDKLLLAMNIQLDPGVILTTTARHTHHAVMFNEDWQAITRDGDFVSTLRAVETEPDCAEIDADTVSNIVDALETHSVFATNLNDHERDVINAIELYADGLYSFDASIQWSYFWFCIENLLGEGRGSGRDTKNHLVQQDLLSTEDADKWKSAVDRIKHPDKGVDSDMTDISLPSAFKCREVASEVLLGRLTDR